MTTQPGLAGYWTEEVILYPRECADILQSLGDASVRRVRAGARHLMSHPTVTRLASDPRLLTIAQRAVGTAAVPYRATLFEKSGSANWLVVWHQDTALPLQERIDSAEWGPWSEKAGILYAHAPAWALEQIVALRVHLDASTHDNGPLRLHPGSHRFGVLTGVEVSAYARTHTCVDCIVGQGGVLAMSPLVIHSSSKARTEAPRRVLNIEYAAGLHLGKGARLAAA